VVLTVFAGMVDSLRFNTERMAEAAIGDFSLATDAADLLAKNGVRFREAHEVVGRLVRQCIDSGKTFADLTLDEWGLLHPVFASQLPPLTALESINARDVPGGTATNRVLAEIAAAGNRFQEVEAWIASENAVRTDVFRRNSSGSEGA